MNKLLILLSIVFTSPSFAAPSAGGCSQTGGGACPQGDFVNGATIVCNVNNPGGPTYKCNNGQWDPVKVRKDGTGTARVGSAGAISTKR